MNGHDGKVLEFPARGGARQGEAGQPDLLWRELAGRVLRSRRLTQGRTLQQVAERAGVSPQYLSEVERGLKDASSEMLESICGALGLRLAELLASSGRLLVTTVRLSTQGGPPSGVTMLAA